MSKLTSPSSGVLGAPPAPGRRFVVAANQADGKKPAIGDAVAAAGREPAPQVARRIKVQVGQVAKPQTPNHVRPPQHSVLESPRSSAPAACGLEDLAAKLVVPMLNAWLDENMPKMIEKALAQEAHRAPAPAKPT